MKRVLSTLIGSSFLAVAGVAVTSSFTPAAAASLTFNTVNFTGDLLKVNYILDDIAAGAGKIQFKVDVVTDSTYKNIADLRGVFFNIGDDSLLSDLMVTGSDVTTSVFGPAGTVQTVGNANLNGDGNTHLFDVGVEIGTNGLKGGSDDFQSTIFTLATKSGKALSLDLFAKQEFGVRATSVGIGRNREGSSKLAGIAPQPPAPPAPQPPAPPAPQPPAPPAPQPPAPPAPQPQAKSVPEPSTVGALLLTGLAALGLGKRRKENKQ